MKIETQILSFLVFFLFGIVESLVYFTFLIKKKKLCYPVALLNTTIFIFILYRTNNGQIHPYFFISFFIGLLISKIFVKYIKNLLLLLKHKQKQ